MEPRPSRLQLPHPPSAVLTPSIGGFGLIGLEELDIRGFLSAIRGRLFLASVLSVTISLLVSLKETGEFIGSVSSNEVLEMVALTAKGHEI